jgi:hypothetical protein
LRLSGVVGISMGGYWALRAAGRVLGIARGGAGTAHRSRGCLATRFRLACRLPAVMRGPVRTMLRRRRLMRWSVLTRARLVPTLRQIVDHTLYLVDGDDPIEVVDWFLGMNADHLGSAQGRRARR